MRDATANAMNSPTLRMFVASVVVVAAAAVGTLPATGLPDTALALVGLAALSAVVGRHSVRIPGTGFHATPSDVFVLAALLVGPPIAAPLVAAAGALGTMILPSGRRQPALRSVFNVAALPLAASAAAWLGVLAFRSPAGVVLERSAFVLLGAVVYLTVNLTLVAAAVALEGRRTFLGTVAAATPWTLVSVVASALVALGLVEVVATVGVTGFLLGVVPVPLLTAYFRAHAKEEVPAAALNPTSAPARSES